MKKLISFLITIALVFSLLSVCAFAQKEEFLDASIPEISAKSALLMEATTGTVLYSKKRGIL